MGKKKKALIRFAKKGTISKKLRKKFFNFLQSNVDKSQMDLNERKVENKMIEIDMTSGEEIEQEEVVQVVVNNPKTKESNEDPPPWDIEPQLQEVAIEEPKEEIPPPVVAKKRTTKRATTAKKKTTTTRRRTTKKTEE